MTKPCPVCGRDESCGSRDCHADFCTPALRSLVRAAEEWENLQSAELRDKGMTPAILTLDEEKLVRAVRRFRKERAK